MEAGHAKVTQDTIQGGGSGFWDITSLLEGERAIDRVQYGKSIDQLCLGNDTSIKKKFGH